ncbi:MAG: undecaprenyl-diphosphate phosphatase [Novosphingobium sp.]|uniref:undecaprenyl-diphosphate phosphatase n=1 Tax=Novosphingobium sp. TaxID=1874826 RepID=UPI001D7A87C6|nr:undecaprenyl-diphosphate phosphatase [Novosphingobium sp.]MCB2058771.1 undecaprenyl-diphosphate phosphatase [Novosphingobium sp.]MCP5386145.1 undecaprenyl-diphosphate phosphatase [Novosphingobium sp.]
MDLTITAILLGIVEGLTEFIPVSSTGHLMLASVLFGYDARTWAVFNVVIQLGAILAVVVLYWRTFWAVAMGLLRLEPLAVRFVVNLLVAFIPAVVLGLLFKDQIDLLLESPKVVAWALIAGGVAILAIERSAKPGEYVGLGQLPVRQALGVGFLQCLAMIPGVSRSGATIMGALAMGIERRTAAEFSFFLAIPTMLGATVLELWDYRHDLAAGTGAVGWGEIAVGFVVAFVVALAVIRLFVSYISRSGFAPFAWYRIAAGALAVFLLYR